MSNIFRIEVTVADLGQGRRQAVLKHYHEVESRFPEMTNTFVAENPLAMELLLKRVQEENPDARWRRT